jgi:hypothetical protein
MTFMQTHANRWVAPARREFPFVVMITQVSTNDGRSSFRTSTWRLGTEERHRLEDAETLEAALAILLAHKTTAA